MSFRQEPPVLGNQYDQDRVLRSYLRRALPREVLTALEPELREMGRLAGGELYQLQLADPDPLGSFQLATDETLTGAHLAARPDADSAALEPSANSSQR